jgi:hypothetical protein
MIGNFIIWNILFSLKCFIEFFFKILEYSNVLIILELFFFKFCCGEEEFFSDLLRFGVDFLWGVFLNFF